METENLRVEKVKIDKNNLIVVGIYEFKYRFKIIQQIVHENRINRNIDGELKEIDNIHSLKVNTK